MTVALSPTLAVDLAAWPGVVLHIDAAGKVSASNGQLEARLGAPVIGRPVLDLLDADSSAAKWRRIVGGATRPAWELIFGTGEALLETGAYSAIPASEGDGFWLVEHPTPRRLTALAGEVTTINTELAATQRRLVVEQGRLAHALRELERSNAALDEFAHAVSHDLKAPLRGIRQRVDALLDPAASEPDRRAADLTRTRELAERMRQMIDAALAYARAGRVSDRIEAIDIGALLRDVVDYLAPPAEVTVDLAPDLPTIETERVPFEQVFRNLLSNAITYRREAAARIAVTAADAGARWELVVADNGPGIPESQQQQVWRLFHTSRPGDGTGLGLALVKRIVESHGGEIELRSTAGSGAAFHVYWPKHPARATGGSLER